MSATVNNPNETWWWSLISWFTHNLHNKCLSARSFWVQSRWSDYSIDLFFATCYPWLQALQRPICSLVIEGLCQITIQRLKPSHWTHRFLSLSNTHFVSFFKLLGTGLLIPILHTVVTVVVFGKQPITKWKVAKSTPKRSPWIKKREIREWCFANAFFSWELLWIWIEGNWPTFV